MSDFRIERDPVVVPPSIDPFTPWQTTWPGTVRYYVDDEEVSRDEYAQLLCEECGD